MAFPDFYNQNERRAYPFRPSVNARFTFQFAAGPVLPDEAILDCGFFLGPVAGFQTDIHGIILKGVKRQGADILFYFDAILMAPPFSSLPGLTGETFIFTRAHDSPRGATDFISLTSPENGVGFLATGSLEALHASLTDGVYMPSFFPSLDRAPLVEPALILSQKGHMVKSVNVGNLTKISAVNCCLPPEEIDENSVQMVAANLTGKIWLKPGYNVTAYAKENENVFVFAPVIGEGMGESCEETFPPLDPGPQCKDLIFTINNVGASSSGVITLIGGNGILIEPVPAQHKIIIHGQLETVIHCGD